MKKEIKDRESKKDFGKLLVSFIYDYYKKLYQEILEIKNLPRENIDKRVYRKLVSMINAYIITDYFVYDRVKIVY